MNKTVEEINKMIMEDSCLRQCTCYVFRPRNNPCCPGWSCLWNSQFLSRSSCQSQSYGGTYHYRLVQRTLWLWDYHIVIDTIKEFCDIALQYVSFVSMIVIKNRVDFLTSDLGQIRFLCLFDQHSYQEERCLSSSATIHSHTGSVAEPYH